MSQDSETAPPAMSSPSDGHGDSDSDSDSVRNPAMPERVQWEYHTRGGWWRGCYQQKELEMAWKAWHKNGCPPNELCGVLSGRGALQHAGGGQQVVGNGRRPREGVKERPTG